MMAFGPLFIGLSSCSDDDNNEPAGKFTLDGTSHNLSKAYGGINFIDEVGDDTYYDWSIILVSSGISYDNDEEGFVGTGEAVILWISVLNDDTFIPPGNYKYSDDTGDCDGIYVDFNVETLDGEAYEDADDASITISKSGNTYTINFTITLEDETVVTGSYKGSITELEG